MTRVHSQQRPIPTWLAIIKLLRWDKPEGRLILMIPALWAVFLATQGKPSWVLVTVIIVGSLATSAAGCVVNDLWDRNIDPQVKRTQSRPLANRTITVRVGVGVAGVAFACAFGLSRFLNPLSFGLCVAAVPVIILYPLAKRVFPVPQIVLAIAWGFSVLISWSAAVGSLPPATGWLWLATVLWTLGFDTIYAMPDRPDDQRLGIHSSALFFGRYAETAIGLFLGGTVVCLGILGYILNLYIGYWLSLGLSSYWWYRQITRLRRTNLVPSAYAQMFRQNVWIGMVLLLGMITGTVLR
ncbi:MAG: 4-hydroxybenzoate solanesyltransferase [Acaryochloris sp. RU_4_1]|nr:4-hydroxybenzoate solanesyltransferase [Acaryochloris sp. RU_4_1]NJR53246.1 4-hydroxybenzoate solanesyltransferase [Acaryochloris sp. CRU_2_0]